MTLIQYSLFLSISILLLGTTTLFSVVSYCFSPLTRQFLRHIPYTLWLKLIGLLAFIATAGSLIYQFIYRTPVCADCWWQRIAMYPIALIVFVSLFAKIKGNHILIGIMAIIGAGFSLQHYSLHFTHYVLGNPILNPCSSLPTDIPCGNAPTLTFDFITIPFLTLIVFLTIAWYAYLAHRTLPSNS